MHFGSTYEFLLLWSFFLLPCSKFNKSLKKEADWLSSRYVQVWRRGGPLLFKNFFKNETYFESNMGIDATTLSMWMINMKL